MLPGRREVVVTSRGGSAPRAPEGSRGSGASAGGPPEGGGGSAGRERRLALGLLAAGAAAGLLLATVGLVGGPAGGPGGPLPEDVVARVNGVPLRGADYRRLVAGLESDLGRPADAERRRFVLQRMIEEELLVQRALDLGLGRLDRRVRAELTGALIASVVGEAEDVEPSGETLRRFYERHRGFFAGPGRLHVRQLFFRAGGADGEGARRRAERALARLRAGEPFAAVAAELGDSVLPPLPDGPLPPAKLREYVGPGAARAAAALEEGATSDPVRGAGGWRLLHLVSREPSVAPPFRAVREQVAAEWRRRRGEEALREYVAQLREDADVEVTAELP